MKHPAVMIALVLSVVAAVDAQGQPEQAALIPLRLEIVFEKYQGEKRVTSEPYMLSLNANDKGPGGFPRGGKIRMGIEIPMRMDRVGDKEVPGNVIYRSIGNAADCIVASVDQARFKVDCTFEQSSIPSGSSTTGIVPPMLRTFRSETSVILRDNQTTQYTTATDPVSSEVLKVAITLSVVK